MREVADLRFEDGEWPIQFVIPENDAEAWMAHLAAEVEERGWNSSGLSQIDSEENTGTLSVHVASGPAPPTLHIVWEKPRRAELRVKARTSESPTLALDMAREFLDVVNERVRKRITARAHRWDLLTYHGLPWRGELWLSDDIRLGPPSQFPNTLLGPQILVVDSMVEGIGQRGILANFHTRVRELQIFLGVVLGIRTTPVRPEDGWVAQFDEQRRPTACTLQSIGYWEVGPPRDFPVRESASRVPRETVVRPGLGRTGFWPDMHEEWVPSDTEDLWAAFTALPEAKRNHFLRAGNAYLIAQSLWPDQRTAYAVFLVISCEALKPPGARHDRTNVYDVVASLIGPGEAARLRDLSIQPQQVRSKHVHRGELLADELLPLFIHNDFADPSFGEMLSVLSSTCRICLIEWLRRAGEYEVVRSRRRNASRKDRKRTRGSTK